MLPLLQAAAALLPRLLSAALLPLLLAAVLPLPLQAPALVAGAGGRARLHKQRRTLRPRTRVRHKPDKQTHPAQALQALPRQPGQAVPHPPLVLPRVRQAPTRAHLAQTARAPPEASRRNHRTPRRAHCRRRRQDRSCFHRLARRVLEEPQPPAVKAACHTDRRRWRLRQLCSRNWDKLP